MIFSKSIAKIMHFKWKDYRFGDLYAINHILQGLELEIRETHSTVRWIRRENVEATRAKVQNTCRLQPLPGGARVSDRRRRARDSGRPGLEARRRWSGRERGVRGTLPPTLI